VEKEIDYKKLQQESDEKHKKWHLVFDYVDVGNYIAAVETCHQYELSGIPFYCRKELLSKYDKAINDINFLKIALDNGIYVVLDLAKEDTFTDELMEQVIKLGITIPENLRYSARFLKKILNNGLYFFLGIFYFDAFNDEIIEEYGYEIAENL